MNRTVKDREIEARLHRSLIAQVRAPQLGRGFEAGVWARIEAEESPQVLGARTGLRRSNAARWLLASNVIGLAVAALLVVFFGLRMFSGAELAMSMPDVSVMEHHQLTDIIAWSITAASLGFGAMFTPLGRWLRAEFS